MSDKDNVEETPQTAPASMHSELRAATQEAVERARAAAKEADEALLKVMVAVETEESRRAEQPLTVAELAEREGVDVAAVLVFAHALGELGVRDPSREAVQRAALLAAAEETWEGTLGPLLDSAQTAQVLGGVSRQRVSELARKHRLIVLRDRDGRLRFPAFQFGDGRPVQALVVAFWVLAEQAESEWTAASWCMSPDDALDGQSPAQWARDGRNPDRLLTVARHDAARLAA